MILERQKLSDFIPNELAKWVRLAKDANIQPELERSLAKTCLYPQRTRAAYF